MWTVKAPLRRGFLLGFPARGVRSGIGHAKKFLERLIYLGNSGGERPTSDLGLSSDGGTTRRSTRNSRSDAPNISLAAEQAAINVVFVDAWPWALGQRLQVQASQVTLGRRLSTVARDRNAPHKHVWRAEIVLLSADGVGTNEIMRRTGKSKTCVWRWQERFMQAGYDGLLRDKTRPSRIPPLGSDIAERVVVLTQTDPPAEATHWTATMMAKAVGISASSVQRIWRTHGLQPHRVHQFKLSNDPRFIDKLRDVVGLYVDLPAHAIVLSVDEKSQIQALDRTQPGLPMKKGRAGTMTHDYKRHGTTTLFAALDILEGKVIGRCMQRHRHQEFIRFLNAIEAQVPVRKIVHVILDNYAAHKHPKVRQWLDRHPRFTFHFTPTSCSWLNAVEGFFAKLAKRRLKRGVFRCVVDLQATINRFVAETNHDPKPFTWTADPDKIIAAVRRGHQMLDSIH